MVMFSGTMRLLDMCHPASSMMKDGVSIIIDVAGYLDQVLVHRMSVTPRHDESGCLALLGGQIAPKI